MKRRSKQRIVVVGGSLAGHSAVSELVGQAPDCDIAWITGETRGTYSKPALSKEYMQAHSDITDFELPPVEADEALLRVVGGRRCTSLDAAARTIELDDGRSIAFDRLIICTGAEALVPAMFSGTKGVLPLRTLDDAIAIRACISGKPKVLVLGGGLIGCELAASMRGLGLDVAMVERLDTLLERPFGGALGDYFFDLHRQNGVEVRTGTTVDRLVERNGALVEAHLSDGTVIETDLVLVGAGSRPSTQWLEGSGIALSNGIVCDSFLATSLTGIYAAGDVARWLNPLFGMRMRVEHWTNASAQGRAAARNLVADMRGRSELARPFGDVPYFWSDQYGHKIQMVGWHEGHDRTEIQYPESTPGPIVTYFIKDRLVAAAGVNAPRAVMTYRRQIEKEARERQVALAEVS